MRTNGRQDPAVALCHKPLRHQRRICCGSTLRDTTRAGGLKQRGLICVHSIIVVLRVDSLLVTPTLVANVIAYLRASPAFTILVNGGPLRGYASNFIHTLHAHHGLLTFGILFPIIPSDFLPSDRFDLRCRHYDSCFPFLNLFEGNVAKSVTSFLRDTGKLSS